MCSSASWPPPPPSSDSPARSFHADDRVGAEQARLLGESIEGAPAHLVRAPAKASRARTSRRHQMCRIRLASGPRRTGSRSGRSSCPSPARAVQPELVAEREAVTDRSDVNDPDRPRSSSLPCVPRSSLRRRSATAGCRPPRSARAIPPARAPGAGVLGSGSARHLSAAALRAPSRASALRCASRAAPRSAPRSTGRGRAARA